MRITTIAALLLALCATVGAQARIRDLVEISGVRDNQIRGIGLVVGLNGTGDRGVAARQMAANLLKRLGNNFLPAQINPDNLGVVMVTATLPPFTRTGARIDITVASMGDASSLRGGQLVATQLVGFDNRTVYAIAEGPVLTGAVSASGATGSKETINHPTAGRIPGGAIVELEVQQKILAPDGKVVMHLRKASYETAKNLAEEINKILPGSARAVDGLAIEIKLSEADRRDVVGCVAKLGELKVRVTPRASVVINERSGTIVAGGDVVVLPVAITHSNLSISVKEAFDVSQPNPFNNSGSTEVIPKSDVSITENSTPIRMLPGAVGAGELAAALKALGVSPLDLITIFQMLKEQGALQAELIVQ